MSLRGGGSGSSGLHLILFQLSDAVVETADDVNESIDEVNFTSIHVVRHPAEMILWRAIDAMLNRELLLRKNRLEPIHCVLLLLSGGFSSGRCGLGCLKLSDARAKKGKVVRVHRG